MAPGRFQSWYVPKRQSNPLQMELHFLYKSFNSLAPGRFKWNFRKVIPHPVASEHRWLVKTPLWIPVTWMSRTCDCDVAVAMRDCGISTTSQTHVPFVNIAFLRSWSIKHRQWKHKLDYNGAVFAHLATRCGINAKDPSRLDSDRWIPHSRCCENPAWAKALAGFSRHLSAGFTDLNPAPRGLSLYDFSNPWLRYLINLPEVNDCHWTSLMST